MFRVTTKKNSKSGSKIICKYSNNVRKSIKGLKTFFSTKTVKDGKEVTKIPPRLQLPEKTIKTIRTGVTLNNKNTRIPKVHITTLSQIFLILTS